jgi:hypothetical protein
MPRTTRRGQHAADNMPRTTRRGQHAADNTPQTTCRRQRAADNMPRTFAIRTTSAGSRLVGKTRQASLTCTRKGLPRSHLRQDWAHPCRICSGTMLAAATSAPGLGSPLRRHGAARRGSSRGKGWLGATAPTARCAAARRPRPTEAPAQQSGAQHSVRQTTRSIAACRGRWLPPDNKRRTRLPRCRAGRCGCKGGKGRRGTGGYSGYSSYCQAVRYALHRPRVALAAKRDCAMGWPCVAIKHGTRRGRTDFVDARNLAGDVAVAQDRHLRRGRSVPRDASAGLSGNGPKWERA